MEKIGELYSSLCVPSSANAYSIAIEYMKKWFLSKFNQGYWKTVHVDGKQVLDDFRHFNITESLKKEKPALAIIPQLVFDFDRDKLDMHVGGLNQMMRRSRVDASFFKDPDKNAYLGIGLEALQMNFTFRMKVSSRAQQVDLYKYLQLAFRIGSTQSENLDLDFHIPYSLMKQLATDTGFEVKDDKIVEPLKFLSYMNSHSIIPVLYKYRNMNGKSEFFLRFRNMYTHIACRDYPSADDGEREGMLSNNFMIDFNVVLEMPSPKMYSYYSLEQHSLLENLNANSEGFFGFTGIKIIDSLEKNDKGWNQFLSTGYYEENLNEPLTIDFKELFEGSDVLSIIEYNNSVKISSSVFVDFKIYNGEDELSYTIDWENLQLVTDAYPKSPNTSILIYMDLAYVQEHIINVNEMNKDRLQ